MTIFSPTMSSPVNSHSDSDHKPKAFDQEPHPPIPSGLPPMATIQDDDELLLARIGYKQVCTYAPDKNHPETSVTN